MSYIKDTPLKGLVQAEWFKFNINKVICHYEELLKIVVLINFKLVVIEREPRGGTECTAREQVYELESSARVLPLTAASSRSYNHVDYEIQGKCTYVCKKQDGVAPSSKHVELKIILFILCQ